MPCPIGFAPVTIAIGYMAHCHQNFDCYQYAKWSSSKVIDALIPDEEREVAEMPCSRGGYLSTMRRAPHEGQNPRCLQENVARLSYGHSAQRSCRKPWAKMPHSRKASNSSRAPPSIGVHKPLIGSLVAARRASRAEQKFSAALNPTFAYGRFKICSTASHESAGRFKSVLPT